MKALATGGFGVAVEAVRVRLGRTVAIMLFHRIRLADQQVVQRAPSHSEDA